MSNINDTITYGTAKFKVVKNITSENIKNIGINGNGEISQNEDGVPVATILPFSGNGNIPIGYLLCDGSAVSREAYPDLFSIIGTTYGEGDGINTFNLPDLRNKFIEGSITAGNEKEAGLPNITGRADLPLVYSTTTGALDADGTGYSFNTSGSYAYRYLHLDASQSNSIYGNSDTVQPPALTMRYIIKAFTGMDNDEALVDFTGIANDLNQKFDPRSDFAIIYPNGGTEANPANILANSRYVENNPFPGYYVNCQAEIFINGKWGAAGMFIYAGGGQGVSAFQYDNAIVINTGNVALSAGSGQADGSPHASFPSGLNNLPCRIKVWKIGKLMNNE